MIYGDDGMKLKMIIGGTTAILVIGAYLLTVAPLNEISTKDPADVVLKLSDLPVGFSIDSERQETPENWSWENSVSYSVMEEFGYQKGFCRTLTRSLTNLSLQEFGDLDFVSSRAYRFSTTSGAKKAYEYWVSWLEDHLTSFFENKEDYTLSTLSHPPIGDESRIWYFYYSPKHRLPTPSLRTYHTFCRKQNFIIYHFFLDSLDNDVLHYLQMVAHRV
jgi:hypothetical protein